MKINNINIHPNTILFFDLDGTLVDTNFSNFLAYKNAIENIMGIDTNIKFNQNQRFTRSILKQFFPKINKYDFENIIRKKEGLYSDYLPHTKLNEFLLDILVQYNKTNQTVLVTNCRKERALETLNYYNLGRFFTNVFFRLNENNTVKVNKYENAISKLGVSPDLITLFENENEEILDARKAGIKNIHQIYSI